VDRFVSQFCRIDISPFFTGMKHCCQHTDAPALPVMPHEKFIAET